MLQQLEPFLAWKLTTQAIRHSHINRGKFHSITKLLRSQSPLQLVHGCQVGWSYPSAWKADCGDAYSRDDAHVPHSLMGWLHSLHGYTWNRLYGMMYHQLPPKRQIHYDVHSENWFCNSLQDKHCISKSTQKILHSMMWDSILQQSMFIMLLEILRNQKVDLIKLKT